MKEPAELQHQAFVQVVGEMWHELQKFSGKGRRLELEVGEDFGTSFVRARASWVGRDGHYRAVVGRTFLFSNLPTFLETTMMFRELQDAQRKKMNFPLALHRRVWDDGPCFFKA